MKLYEGSVFMAETESVSCFSDTFPLVCAVCFSNKTAVNAHSLYCTLTFMLNSLHLSVCIVQIAFISLVS